MLNKYFEKYGHKCRKDLDKPFQKVLQNKSGFRKWFLKYSIISQNHILLRSHPRSHASLRKAMLYQMENFSYTLHPFSVITYYLDLIWGLVIMFFFISKPIDIFLHVHSKPLPYIMDRVYIRVAFSILGLLDCIRRFFTGYMIKNYYADEIVLDYKLIAVRYLKHFFLIDFLPSIQGILLLAYNFSPLYQLILELLSIIRIFRLGTLKQVIRNVMRFYHINHTFIDTVSGITVLCLILHWVSCFSVLPGIIERMIHPNAYEWYDEILSRNSSVMDNYVLCFYRTISVLTGRGYDFILERTKSEKDMIYIIFTSVLGHVLTLIIFAKLHEIINGLRSASAKYEEMWSEISNYLKHRNLSDVTQDKVKTYYGFKYNYSYFNEYELLDSLPVSLRQTILMYSSKLLLENIEYLEKLPIPVVTNIVSHLAKHIFLAGDVIFRSGEHGNSMYFLLSGTVAMFTQSGWELYHHEDGSEFGQCALIRKEETHAATAVAIETTEVVKLYSNDFQALLDYCPDLVQLLIKIANSRMDMAEVIDERYKQLNNRRLLQTERNTESRLDSINPFL